MDPLVSILIPAFNAEAWIAETLKSALGQTWGRKEIIIVDDGSTDQTLAIARRFDSQRVCVLTQPNQGASAARNTALSRSQGDYIQWLDADDLLAPDKIAKQMEALPSCRSRRTLLSSEWGHFVCRSSRASFTPTPLWRDLSPVDWLLLKMERNLHMQPATWLVSRELTTAAGPWDIRLSLDDDGEYFCRVLLASDGSRFVPQAKMFYRRSGFASLSNVGRSSRKLESQFLSMQLHVRYLRSLEDSERVRAACLKYLQNWLSYFYPERPDLVAQLGQVAAALGGALEIPPLPWQYSWIEGLFGRTVAKRTQIAYNELKSSLIRSWDKALYRWEMRNIEP
jgi:glycosyltransferase involved in cell wall biosynthesis